MIEFRSNFDVVVARVDAVVNTVNCVGVMGKGIALQFKQKYPENFKKYKRACDNKQVVPGKMFVVKTGGAQPKFIINFPTKDHWRGNSKAQYIIDGLKDLKNIIIENNIKSIAVPPLGCGNGGLMWEDVKLYIKEALSGIDADIIIAEPYENKTFNAIKSSTSDTITSFRALVIFAIRIYNSALSGIYELGNIEIQKLVYFLACLSGDKKLIAQYQQGQYGPYNPKLKNALINMSHFLTGLGDGTEVDHIDVTEEALEKSKELVDKDIYLKSVLQELSKIIYGYETLYGMELLGTVHWVCKNYDNRSLADVILHVQSWNARKRAIMSEQDITVAYKHLIDCGMI